MKLSILATLVTAFIASAAALPHEGTWDNDCGCYTSSTTSKKPTPTSTSCTTSTTSSKWGETTTSKLGETSTKPTKVTTSKTPTRPTSWSSPTPTKGGDCSWTCTSKAGLLNTLNCVELASGNTISIPIGILKEREAEVVGIGSSGGSYCCNSKAGLLNLLNCIDVLSGNTIEVPISIL